MTDELVFEEPSSTKLRLGPRKYERILSPLVARPMEWARIVVLPKQRALHLASSLRSGRGTTPPEGRWEFVAAPPKDNPDSPVWGVYARNLGPEESAAALPSSSSTAAVGAGGPARLLAGSRVDRNPPAPPPSEEGEAARSTSPGAPGRRREDRTLVLPKVPGVNSPARAPATTADGQPKCGRKGCSRPAGKGSPWCVPQRWCEGRAGAPVAAEHRGPLDPLNAGRWTR